jgi:TonB family protein
MNFSCNNSRSFSLLRSHCFLCLLGLLLNCSISIGQDTIRLYYNSNWEITTKEKASFIRKAVYDLSTFKLDGAVQDFTISGTLLMSGHYNSDRREGEFIFNYPNGSTKSKGKYNDNQRLGNWEFYYDNGKLKQKATFKDNSETNLFSIDEFYDRDGNQLIKNGTGAWLNDSIVSNSLEDSGLFRLTGQFKDSLRTGIWKLIRISDNKLIHSEQFRKGRFLEATVWEPMFNSYGTTSFEFLNLYPDENLDKLKKAERFVLDTTSYPSNLINADVSTILRAVTGKNYYTKNRRAGYLYGDQNLLDFIGTNIKYPISALQNKITGKVYIKVVIDSLGKTKEVSVFKGVNKDLDAEALRVIKSIDTWLPAIKDGKAIESSISIPVTFDIKQ